jgi:dihydroorotate dehydrogenase (fumarate)
MDLSTEYMGLVLDNPVIAGSSGPTGSSNRSRPWRTMAPAPPKSIFEVEITTEYGGFIKTAKERYGDPQYFDYDGQRSAIEYYDFRDRDVTIPGIFI